MAERVPGTIFTADSTALARRSSSARSGPKIFTPTGVRIPVASMSMRPLIGMVHEFVTPAMRSSPSIAFTRPSYVMPRRHSSSGFSTIVVSNIDSGAGSVAVVARPAFPNTLFTSGKAARIESWTRRVSLAFATLMPGSVVGMYRIVPSFSGGMNSEPISRIGRTVSTSAASAPATTGQR